MWSCGIMQRIRYWRHLEMQRHCEITTQVVLESLLKYILMQRYECFCYLCLYTSFTVLKRHSFIHPYFPFSRWTWINWFFSCDCLEKNLWCSFCIPSAFLLDDRKGISKEGPTCLSYLTYCSCDLPPSCVCLAACVAWRLEVLWWHYVFVRQVVWHRS